MFFRLKPTGSGQVLKLIESYRDEAGVPRHRTVVSLGNAALKEVDWKPVAKAVEDRLYRREVLLERELSEGQRGWVDRIVRQVASEGRWSPRPSPAPGEAPIDGVLAAEVGHSETAELGPVLVGWRIWNRLGLPELLERLGLNRSQSQAAAILVINRLVEPASEHGLLDWYRRTGLAELMGNRLRGAGDDRFYRAGDRLLERQRAIEQHLRERQRSLFNLDRTVLLYDLTNTHFEGVCRANPKARRGANKQKRNDCPQIVVGMVFDGFGFEMAHQVFEGSMHDSESLVRMIGELEAAAGAGPEKPLVVVDAGVASRRNLRVLREHGFGYLVNDSRRQRERYHELFGQAEGFHPVEGREAKEPVWVRVLDDPEAKGAERIVLCRSARRGAKERAIASNAERRFQEQLRKLAVRVDRGQLRDPAKVQQAIGRLQARHPRVRRYYHIEAQPAPGGLRLCWARHDAALQRAAELFGCYVLRTDERTLNEHQLWHLYISLTRAEDGFRALKSHLGLRPNPHQNELRVEAHVFLCVLAYHLLRTILWSLEQKGDPRSWPTLKQLLQTHCYTTILLPTREGLTHRLRRAGHPDEVQKAIYRDLGIEWRGLPTHQTVLAIGSHLRPPDAPQATL